jgi:hypothetical protein
VHDQIIAGLIAAIEAEIVKAGVTPALKARTADRYRADLMGAARQFWKDGSRGGLITRMKEITKFGLRDAWDEGGAALGITPENYTEQDLAVRDEIITEEQSHITDLVDYIDALANSGQPLSNADTRLDIWARRFGDVKDRAKVVMGKDAKLEWVYDPTKEHCTSCARLNGIVKRASFWQANGVLPKSPPNPMLACGGWQCGCILQPTDKKLTRGRLPKLP